MEAHALEESTRATRVAVCVITYRRPEGLTRLLAALDALLPADPPAELRIEVVDNDPGESARGVCEGLAPRIAYPLAYHVEKRRGIPQARNAALARAFGWADFVAFIDDDETPRPEWLAELLRAQRTAEADAVTGPCLPDFEEDPPAWIEEGRFFERPRHADGSRLQIAFTHNTLVRSAALQRLDHCFDERMALTGGSDIELFRRFARNGNSIVWADGAAVCEHVPASRVSLGWLLRRAFRVGVSHAWIDKLHAPGLRTALHIGLHGLWCVAKGSGQLALSVLRGRIAAAIALRLGVFGAGRLWGLAGLRYREYAVTHGS